MFTCKMGNYNFVCMTVHVCIMKNKLFKQVMAHFDMKIWIAFCSYLIYSGTIVQLMRIVCVKTTVSMNTIHIKEFTLIFFFIDVLGVHCGIYQSSYNISNISHLNSPPPHSTPLFYFMTRVVPIRNIEKQVMQSPLVLPGPPSGCGGFHLLQDSPVWLQRS
jgi:hypothetical protein